MYCPKCGSKILEGNICSNCGYAVLDEPKEVEQSTADSNQETSLNQNQGITEAPIASESQAIDSNQETSLNQEQGITEAPIASESQAINSNQETSLNQEQGITEAPIASESQAIDSNQETSLNQNQGITEAPIAPESQAIYSNQGTNNNGGNRKSLKKDAKSKNKGTLIIATILFMVIVTFLTSIFNYTIIKNNATILSLFSSLISSVFIFGFFSACLKVSKNESITLSDVFLKPFNSFKSLLKTLVIYVIYSLLAMLLLVVPILGLVVLVANIYFLPVFYTYIFLCIEESNKEETIVNLLKRALDITKGHRVEFYGLMFSFIGWIILSPLTLGILFIWLIPYMMISFANLYRKWTGEVVYDSEKSGMSDKAVVGITIGGSILFIIVTSVLIIGMLTSLAIDFKDILENKDQINWQNEGQINRQNKKVNEVSLESFSGDKYTFKLPSGCTQSNSNLDITSSATIRYKEDITFFYDIVFAYNTLEEQLEKMKVIYVDDNVEKDEIEKDLTINGKPAKYYSASSDSNSFACIIYAVDNNNYIELSTTSSSLTEAEILKFLIEK